MEGRARRLHADRADHRRPHLSDRAGGGAPRGFANHDSLAREPGRGGGRSRSRRRGLERGASTQAHPHRPGRRPAIDDGRRACERDRPGQAVARPGHAISARLRVILGDPGRSVPERCHVERADRDGVGAGLLPPGHDVARRVGEGPVSRSEAGVTLIELVVAMALLSLVLVSVAQLNFALARRFYAVSGGAARDAVVAQQVNQFTAMPFDSLKSRAGTITVTKPPLPYTRKVMVDSLSPRLRRVTVVVTPLNTLFRPDTVVLQRTKPGKNPLDRKSTRLNSSHGY